MLFYRYIIGTICYIRPTVSAVITLFEISCLFMREEIVDSFRATLFIMQLITRTRLDGGKSPSACSLSGSVSCLWFFFYDVIKIFITHCCSIKYSFFSIIQNNFKKYLHTKCNIIKIFHKQINGYNILKCVSLKKKNNFTILYASNYDFRTEFFVNKIKVCYANSMNLSTKLTDPF